jgi:hypothetical protein
MKTNQRNYLLGASILIVMALLFFILGSGQDSNDAIGNWKLHWSKALCVVIESRNQKLATSGWRAMFGV